MARITRVAKAQQRYEQVPVIDPETGEQKRTPVMKNGKQKVTKTGRPVFMDITTADKNQPLPNRKCGKCGNEITVGSPYKHISPRSGPYGGRTLYRCISCPDWNVWEYSSSLSARVAEISFDFSNEQGNWESQDDVQSSLNDAAERVREIASEKEESAQNIEDGFGHSTSMSEELADVAQQLNDWADEIESADIPDYPEGEEQDCDQCDGTGQVENDEFTEEAENIVALGAKIKLLSKLPSLQVMAWVKKLVAELEALEEAHEDTDEEIDCEYCDGSGRIENDEPTQDQIEEWRSEVESAVSIVDECPV
jgi:hypothetical protein